MFQRNRQFKNSMKPKAIVLYGLLLTIPVFAAFGLSKLDDKPKQGQLIIESFLKKDSSVLKYISFQLISADGKTKELSTGTEGKTTLKLNEGNYQLISRSPEFSSTEKHFSLTGGTVKNLQFYLVEVADPIADSTASIEKAEVVETEIKPDTEIEMGVKDEGRVRVAGKARKGFRFDDGSAMAPSPSFEGAVGEPHGADASRDAAHYDKKVVPGTLTAGETVDLNKWELWQDLTDNEFSQYQNTWDIPTKTRYKVWVLNKQDLAVVDCKVKLMRADSCIWATHSDNRGMAELWADSLEKEEELELLLEYEGGVYVMAKPVSFKRGINQVKLPVSCYSPYSVDIAFVVDATGSMGDEIRYLKTELLDVIKKVQQSQHQLSVNLGALFYRDRGDQYVVRSTDLHPNIDKTVDFINMQSAGGGGDFPEALDTALFDAVNEFSWSEESRARLMFLVLDAPPHSNPDAKRRVELATKMAAEKGIRLIPVVGSGIDKQTEYLMRSMALATNGTYIFLTDHSGVGGSHLAPSTDQYDVKPFNQLLEEVIIRFTQVQNCDGTDDFLLQQDSVVIMEKVVVDSTKHYTMEAKDTFLLSESGVIKKEGEAEKNIDPIDKPLDLTMNVFPNPTTGPITVALPDSVDNLYLADMNGRYLRKFVYPEGRSFSLNLTGFPPAMYYLVAEVKGQRINERIILRK